MTVDMVVRNGKVYTPYGFYEGSVVIDDGKVVSLMKGVTPEADEVIDAGGLHVDPLSDLRGGPGGEDQDSRR